MMLAFVKKIINREKKDSRVLCIQIKTTGCSIALVEFSPAPVIRECSYFPGTVSAQNDALKLFVEQHQLQGITCNCVLSMADYQLMFIERPKVIESEMSAAVRWLVKDLIDFPIEEAVIDTFPAPVRVGQTLKVYAVAVRLSWLNQVATIIKNAGLNLKKIDISVLAVRDILLLQKDADKGALLLLSDNGDFHVLIAKDQFVYLHRKLNFNISPDAGNKAIDELGNELVSEILRSIDFYQGNDFSQAQGLSAAAMKIFVDPTLSKNNSLIQYIEKALAMPVETMEINNKITGGFNVPQDIQSRCLSVIGEGIGLTF